MWYLSYTCAPEGLILRKFRSQTEVKGAGWIEKAGGLEGVAAEILPLAQEVYANMVKMYKLSPSFKGNLEVFVDAEKLSVKAYAFHGFNSMTEVVFEAGVSNLTKEQIFGYAGSFNMPGN